MYVGGAFFSSFKFFDMPLLGALGMSAINAGVSVGTNFLNAGIQNRLNEKTNQRNLDFYRMQRADALTDWTRDAEYNSPSAMMGRLGAAGINPHTVTGGSPVTVSSPQMRAPTMQGAAAPYQVQNRATDVSQNLAAIEQLKGMQLQNEKTVAETDQIRANTKQTGLNYEVDTKTLLPRREGEIRQQAAAIAATTASTEQTQQQVQNLKAQLLKTLADTQVSKIEGAYKGKIMSNTTKIQDLEQRRISASIEKLESEINSLNVSTSQSKRMFPRQVEEIIQRTNALRSSSTGTDIENQYKPDFYFDRNRGAFNAAEMSSDELKYLRTLTPKQRFLLDKLLQAVPAVSRFR